MLERGFLQGRVRSSASLKEKRGVYLGCSGLLRVSEKPGIDFKLGSFYIKEPFLFVQVHSSDLVKNAGIITIVIYIQLPA